MREIFASEGGSTNGEEAFFSVAKTTPFLAAIGESNLAQAHIGQSLPLIPSDVTP